MVPREEANDAPGTLDGMGSGQLVGAPPALQLGGLPAPQALYPPPQQGQGQLPFLPPPMQQQAQQPFMQQAGGGFHPYGMPPPFGAFPQMPPPGQYQAQQYQPPPGQ